MTQVWCTRVFAPVDQQGQTTQLVIHEAKDGTLEGLSLALFKVSKGASARLI